MGSHIWEKIPIFFLFSFTASLNGNDDYNYNDEDLTDRSHSINPTQPQLRITFLLNAVFECSKCYLCRWYFRKCSRYSKQGALKFEILEGACMPVANT